MSDTNLSPGLLRQLREDIEHAQKAGQGDPYTLAERACALLGRELAQVAEQRDALVAAVIGEQDYVHAAENDGAEGTLSYDEPGSEYAAALAQAAEMHRLLPLRAATRHAEKAEAVPAAIRPVLADPVTRHEYDEDGNAYDPFVRWDLSVGCTVTLAFDGDALDVTVSTSDRDQRDGITKRAVTREQIAAYARQLLALVGETDPMHAVPGDVVAALREADGNELAAVLETLRGDRS